MPHIPVPAAELNTRLDRLRCAMTEKDPALSLIHISAQILSAAENMVG